MIKQFEGEYRFLSNFWHCPIVYQDKLWKSAEHIYQAMKTADEQKQEEIRLLETAGQAKKAGKRVVIRIDWNEIRDSLMKKIVWKKFRQNADLREKLLATGDQELQEGNWWGDVYWGISTITGVGENKLGLILQETREKLRTANLHCDICSGDARIRCVKSFSQPVDYLYSECPCDKDN